jgi:hypothetical protein
MVNLYSLALAVATNPPEHIVKSFLHALIMLGSAGILEPVNVITIGSELVLTIYLG